MNNNAGAAPFAAADLWSDGLHLRDGSGRLWLPRGINLIYKGKKRPEGGYAFYPPDWPKSLHRQLHQQGYDLLRFGILWAALEPEPGQYDEAYFDYILYHLDAAAEAGLSVILDMHQDLFAQRFSDGAPDWAVMSDAPFEETALWSDAYLFSPAVQQSWDAFWENRPVPATRRGLQDHLAALWQEIARRFHGHPVLLGYDILNEPAPGSEIQQMFGELLSAFAGMLRPEEAQQLGLMPPSPEALYAVFSDPEQKLKALGVLEDAQRFWHLGEACASLVQRFEREVLAPFYTRVATAIRSVDQQGYLLRAHNYLSNLGIPPALPPIEVNGQPDPRQLFTPHGYDLVVDTEAIILASDSRAHTIFKRHRQTQMALQLPALVGEWGAFGPSPVALRHGDSLLNQFEQYQWGSCYWCWEPGFFETPAAKLLRRPRAARIAGELLRQSYDSQNGLFTLAWREPEAGGPADSLLWLPTAPEHGLLDGQPLTGLEAGWQRIQATGGPRQLALTLP